MVPNDEHSPLEESMQHAPEEAVLEDATFLEKLRNLSYLTFLLIGVALLWPWNCFLSASLYFQHDVFHDDTIYAKIYISTMMSISTLSSVAFNFWLSTRQHGYAKRIVRGLIWEVVVFGSLCVLVSIHKLLPTWLTFTILMLLVLTSSVGTAMTQNGAMAMANVFGSQFSQAVMVGQAIAGVLPSLVLFGVSFIGDPRNQSTGGIFAYFFTTAMVSVACIILYRASAIGAADKYEMIRDDNTTASDSKSVPFSVLFSKLKYLVLSIFTAFVVTLVFPVFAAHTFVAGLPIHNSQYIPLIFTVWNLGDLYGRVISNYDFFQNPKFTPFKTFIYSIARIGLVPLFFCFNINNASKTKYRTLSDLLYILLQFVFGVTNGNVISVSFMKVSSQLDTDKERKAAGGFTTVFVSTGLALGSIISYLFVYFISISKP
ncbi:LAFE_0D11034g1_1 [Lachancea fermentati]|uniref:LAFE_0D11034g1_1 n=1 Tax=Lachancea fermentati TaxID=4955 RepID=A0A1G4MBS6_LACFM|nr:LAFE_0D11034g1_1 [Lachancea fermentati]